MNEEHRETQNGSENADAQRAAIERHESLVSQMPAEAIVPAGGGVDAASLSDDAVAKAWAGELCLACGGRKTRESAFCATDTTALTIWRRQQMSWGPETEYFAQNFRVVLAFLQALPTRAFKLPVRRGEWAHQSDADLEKAGYKFITHERCSSPRCDGRIVWYWTPNKNKIAVNADGTQLPYQPHYATSCKDPEWMERRRVQASARRKRGSR